MSNTQTKSRAGYIKAMWRPNAIGGTWATRQTEYEAVNDVLLSAYLDWKDMFDLKAVASKDGMLVSLYRDAGTKSHDDDVYIKTIRVRGDYIKCRRSYEGEDETADDWYETTAFIPTSTEVVPCES